MTNGIFKSYPIWIASARATNIKFIYELFMSTQSAFCFEWSVKCIGCRYRFCVGIASQLKREIEDVIINYDQNAIMVSVGYYIGSPRITRGNNTIHSNLTKHKTGDIIRFRFDPHAKKLLIDSVRILKGRIYINLLIILE